MKIIGNQSGVSLLETIIAAAIVAVGVVAVITLIIASQRAGRVSEQELVAMSLAQEGLEAVREIRDSNWLAIDSGYGGTTNWDTGLYDTGQGGGGVTSNTAIAVFDPSANTWTLDFTPQDFDTVCSDHVCSDVFIRDSLYLQTPDTLQPDDQGADFQRLLTFQNICSDGTNEIITEESCNTALPGSKKTGMSIVSQVRHQDPEGNSATYEVDAEVYNWRPGVADTE